MTAHRVGSVVAIGMVITGCAVERVPPSDVPERVRAALAECRPRGPEKQGCYEGRLLEQLEQQGVGSALAVLEGIAEADVDVERDGHVYTHAIGIHAYSSDEAVTGVFEQCTELFQSGCYHGVIQAYFLAHGADDDATVRGLCDPYQSDEERWLLFQCLHGLGHGLTMFYGHRLPQALETCDLLASIWDRESCYGGAFMENVVSVTNPHDPAAEAARASEGSNGGHEHGATVPGAPMDVWEHVRADDPQYPCSVVGDRYKSACYTMQTSVMLWLNGWDVGAAAQSCGEAPEGWRATCFQSLGRDLSSRTLQAPDASLSECQHAPETYRAWCYVGLVKNFVDLTATTEAGFDFCRRVEDFAKPLCNEALGEQIWTLHGTPEGRRAACAVAESPELERACLRGARVGVG